MTNQDRALHQLQQELASLQGRFDLLEARLAKQWARLDEAYITRQARRLFWQKLWQALDWLFYSAIGSGIGLVIAHAMLKG